MYIRPNHHFFGQSKAASLMMVSFGVMLPHKKFELNRTAPRGLALRFRPDFVCGSLKDVLLLILKKIIFFWFGLLYIYIQKLASYFHLISL